MAVSSLCFEISLHEPETYAKPLVRNDRRGFFSNTHKITLSFFVVFAQNHDLAGHFLHQNNVSSTYL